MLIISKAFTVKSHEAVAWTSVIAFSPFFKVLWGQELKPTTLCSWGKRVDICYLQPIKENPKSEHVSSSKNGSSKGPKFRYHRVCCYCRCCCCERNVNKRTIFVFRQRNINFSKNRAKCFQGRIFSSLDLRLPITPKNFFPVQKLLVFLLTALTDLVSDCACSKKLELERTRA